MNGVIILTRQVENPWEIDVPNVPDNASLPVESILTKLVGPLRNKKWNKIGERVTAYLETAGPLTQCLLDDGNDNDNDNGDVSNNDNHSNE